MDHDHFESVAEDRAREIDRVELGVAQALGDHGVAGQSMSFT
jgi:hypothetical protein